MPSALATNMDSDRHATLGAIMPVNGGLSRAGRLAITVLLSVLSRAGVYASRDPARPYLPARSMSLEPS